MGYSGRDPGMVTRMDTAQWGCGLNDDGVKFPDNTGVPRNTAWPAAEERRIGETTISEGKKPHRIYMRLWPFWRL